MKKQGNADLVEYLLKTKLKLRRGKAGRPTAGPWTTGLMIMDDLHESWYGPGQDYRLCVNLALAFKDPKKSQRRIAQTNVLNSIKEKAFKGKQRDFFQRLADAMEATKNVPFDPSGVAVKLAYKIHRMKSKADPTQAQVVAIAEDFFDMKTAKERDSVRASLFRTAKKLLRS